MENLQQKSTQQPKTCVQQSNKRNKQSKQINQQNTYKAGNVQIRGMYRRIWRPRYLEICDDGTVRYYEVIKEGAISSSTSLTTTDRSLKKSRQSSNDDDDLTIESIWEDMSIVKEQTNAKTMNKLKAIMTIHDARLLNPKLNRDAHITIPNGYYGFLFHGSSFYVEKDNAATSTTSTRDFLCMVSYREEAKQWVQALQWAAGLMLLPPVSSYAGRCIGNNTMLCNAYKKCSSIEEEDQNNELVLDDQTKTNVIITKPKNNGTILITKLRKFTISNNEVKYILKLLKFKNNQNPVVEEYTYHIPISKLLNLFFLIQKEYVNDDDIYYYLLNHNPSDVHTTYKLPHYQMRNKIEKLDEVVRFLSSNDKICNSDIWKRFLGLDGDRNTFVGTKKYRVENKEEFVKSWLWKDEDDLISLYDWVVFYCISYPWKIRVFGIGTVSMIVLLYNHYSSSLSYNITITIPLYIWIGTFLVIFYFGYSIGQSYPNLVLKFLECVIKPKKQNKESDTKNKRKLAKKEKKTKVTKNDSSTKPESIPDQKQENNFKIDNEKLDTIEQTPQSIETKEIKEESISSTSSMHSSPLPKHPGQFNNGTSCWSQSPSHLFKVRGKNYLNDRIKYPSGEELFTCRGVDVFLTYDPLYHIARHPSVLGGKLWEEDTLVINFLLPFCNFVAYFQMNEGEDKATVRNVWRKFLKGDQQYRDARLKMLPLVIDGPWIVRKAVGPGNAPAVLSKVLPLQYYLTPNNFNSPNTSSIFEIDVIISASRMANAILNVVKGHTKNLTIAFAFIIEGVCEEELPENIICSFTMHELDLAKCPPLPKWNGDVSSSHSSGSLEDSEIFSNSNSDDEVDDIQENEKEDGLL